jgi:polysaccharide pyruvyl transferase WcaK-like protein
LIFSGAWRDPEADFEIPAKRRAYRDVAEGSMRLSRRTFLAGAAALAAGGAAPALVSRRPRILLRSSWQTVNIGDIAHTPGMLRLLEEHVPQGDVTLWPNLLSDDVQALLRKRFPGLRVARTAEEQRDALSGCDFFLHGSGPGLVGAREAKSWQASGKPYGFGGVTLSDAELQDHKDLLAGARFVYCRDTLSLEALKAAKVAAPIQDFGPDATFSLDLQDDGKAGAFLKEQGLESGRFACFVPRLRWTPYWKEGRKMAAELVQSREAENERHREADHAKLRTAIAAWVTTTGLKVLLCPEMTYQVELLKPLLFDPLPADVKAKVVVRPGYWLPDEAASTYRRAAAVVSLEMHSPIIAIANGRPAIHLRQPTDTRKGQMWRDVGLKEWLFEIDDATGEQIAERLLALHREGPATEAAVARAKAFTAARGLAMMQAVAANL